MGWRFNKIKSLNWHFWPNCNYDCTFCFGKFSTIDGKLSKTDYFRIIKIISTIGIEKLTLTGGEPFLCPFLGDLVIEAKKRNLTTMIVTNGSLLTESFLEQYHPFIDWIGISIDSFSEETEFVLGRGTGHHVHDALQAITLIKHFNIKLKINTVITRLNYKEYMGQMIENLSPERWKVFQVLPIQGENDGKVDSLLINNDQFMSFINNHLHLEPIYEPNALMLGSYIMLDPLGRFFQNSKGYIEYSSSILDTDPFHALAEVGWDEQKFLKRGGIYDW